MEDIHQNSFSALFKKFRLLSQFKTLQQFSSSLSEYGLEVDPSLLSRWQSASRIPSDRTTILMLIKVFVSANGIKNCHEANELMVAAGQGELTDDELNTVCLYGDKTYGIQIPRKISNFVGRVHDISLILQNAEQGKVIVIKGIGGSGKTTLVIEAAHRLKDFFIDGIFWFRMDTITVHDVLRELAQTFNLDYKEENRFIQAAKVRSFLTNKKILLILDNVDDFESIEELFPNSSTCSVILTTRHTNSFSNSINTEITMNQFSPQEAHMLFEKILSEEFSRKFQVKLNKLAKLCDFSPLGIHVLAKAIYHKMFSLDSLISDMEATDCAVLEFSEDGKTLLKSIDLSFGKLDNNAQSLLIHTALFSGKDFSLEALSFVSNSSEENCHSNLARLISLSLVERSVAGRYRIHPFIKSYLIRKINNEMKNRFTHYYSGLIANDLKFHAQYEIENFKKSLLFCIEIASYDRLFSIWENFSIYLWDSGRWDSLEELTMKVLDVCEGTHDYKRLSYYLVTKMSWLEFWRGNIMKSYQYAERALSMARKAKDQKLIAICKQRLGVISNKLKSSTKATQFLEEAHKYFKKNNEYELLIETLMYIGHVHRDSNKYLLAEKFYKKSLGIGEKNKITSFRSKTLYYLGDLLLQLEKYEESEKYLQESLLIDTKNKRKAGIAWCNLSLAKLERAQKNFASVTAKLEISKKLFQELNMREPLGEITQELLSVTSLAMPATISPKV